MNSERLFQIGRIWLIIDAFVFAVMGMALAIFPDSFLFTTWIAEYRELFEPVSDRERRFLLAPLGATIFGNYVLFGFVAIIPLRDRNRWAWWAMVGSFFAWFGLDSFMSLHHGARFNFTQINLVALLIQVPPLLMTAPVIFKGMPHDK